MSNEWLGSSKVTDHDVTLTITGEIESLRPRLRAAIEKLGYTILGEQPLYGKRGAQGGARRGCSLAALDYPTRLTIALKQINDIAVVATFQYEVKSCVRMTKGDRQTLLREAEAIAALGKQGSISACPACATAVIDDSHFCRRCGAPLVVEVAELEVLRLTKKSRSAHNNLMIGVVALCVAAALFSPLLWVEPKLFRALLIIGSGAAVFGIFALLQGVLQLHLALGPKTAELPVRAQQAFTARPTAALHPAMAPASITEGTTELLDLNIRHDERQGVLHKVLDTGEVDDERLM
ncbi:MAG TPA: zinc ribbon domain-containing protein [Pyrinomonadaceae bacterium]|jgi:hypothetical protein|nr:zinc ribbon domain-containing protein [Pyrinomonadaceae bacterium]